MAKKSKTQRAKASVTRAQKREQTKDVEAGTVSQIAEETPAKKGFKLPFMKSGDEVAPKQEEKKPEKSVKAEKVERFRFLKDVRAELRRVTWPSKQDVGRWTVVAVAALVFFSVFVMILDNWIVTPFLLLISSIG